MKNNEEIDEQIKGLIKVKDTTPEFNFFGDNNWESIDVQLSILRGDESLEDIDEGDWDEMDAINRIYRSAEEADEWLHGNGDEDSLFEE